MRVPAKVSLLFAFVWIVTVNCETVAHVTDDIHEYLSLLLIFNSQYILSKYYVSPIFMYMSYLYIDLFLKELLYWEI